MGRRKTFNPMITTSVKISPEFHQLCYQENISFSEALRVGISVILAERGIREYDNNLNIVRKMNLFRSKAEESLAKIYELEEKFRKLNDNKQKVTA